MSKDELKEVNGGGIVAGIIIGGIATPFVLGAIAGGADEYARRKGGAR
ncbi:class IIb bacteriocin, lactobin A/cerein 7B family [Marinilactibacillus psychrotolerans]